ncbi:unnamed protein product, partial [Adineta steineri]
TSTSTIDHLNSQTNDGYSSTSTLGVSTINSDDSSQHPLLPVISSKNRRKNFFSCLTNNTTTMDTNEEQLINEDICLLDTKLPKELLLRIFSYIDYKSLCRCAQVSKYWNTLALDGSNWQSINLKSFQRDVDGIVLENLSKQCGSFLKRLDIENCKFINDHNMRNLSNNCPNLERLTVKHCTKLSNTSLYHLSKHCPYLNHINIASCHHIDDQGIKMISSNCSNLEWIDISWCMN